MVGLQWIDRSAVISRNQADGKILLDWPRVEGNNFSAKLKLMVMVKL
jgi:hypothetical protein